jgi:hypothetical protein
MLLASTDIMVELLTVLSRVSFGRKHESVADLCRDNTSPIRLLIGPSLTWWI